MYVSNIITATKTVTHYVKPRKDDTMKNHLTFAVAKTSADALILDRKSRAAFLPACVAVTPNPATIR